MNKLNDIFNKIAKMEQNAQEVKLGMHKVELGAIDVYIEAYKKEAAKIGGIKNKLISANDELGMLLGSLESLPQIGDKLIGQMKELGIEQELQNVQAVNNAIKGLIKSLNPIYKTISNSAKSI